MPNGPAKGQKTPLLHSLKARERVIAALRWDPREDKVGIVGRVVRQDSQHDMDIACFLFDDSGNYADFVGSEAQDSMDVSGCVYHSGDDMTGEGGGDDEFISAELADLPEYIHHLVFVVEMRSRHSFGEVESPMVRLADGMTGTNLLETPIGQEEGRDSVAFVFARLARDPAGPTGWSLHHIGEYPDISGIEDWGVYLTKYLN